MVSSMCSIRRPAIFSAAKLRFDCFRDIGIVYPRNRDYARRDWYAFSLVAPTVDKRKALERGAGLRRGDFGGR